MVKPAETKNQLLHWFSSHLISEWQMANINGTLSVRLLINVMDFQGGLTVPPHFLPYVSAIFFCINHRISGLSMDSIRTVHTFFHILKSLGRSKDYLPFYGSWCTVAPVQCFALKATYEFTKATSVKKLFRLITGTCFSAFALGSMQVQVSNNFSYSEHTKTQAPTERGLAELIRNTQNSETQFHTVVRNTWQLCEWRCLKSCLLRFPGFYLLCVITFWYKSVFCSERFHDSFHIFGPTPLTDFPHPVF